MWRSMVLGALVLVVFAMCVGMSLGADWPSVRGPGWDGRSVEVGLAERWPEGGPPVLWVRELGEGYSSFVIWGDRAATMYQTAVEQRVICLDMVTGETVWEHGCGWPYERGGRYPGPRSTPAYADGRIYFCAADGLVGCLEAATGREVWSVHLQSDLGAEVPGFGYSCTPTVISGLVLLPVGGPNSALIALDASTGEVRWRGGDEEGSYVGILPITFRGRRLVVACLQNHVVCHELLTGKREWVVELSRGYDEHSCWPLYEEPLLWISGPFKKGGMMLELTGEASVPVRELRRGDPISNDIFSSVLAGGAVYGFDVLEPQSSAWRSTRGIFRCLDFATGVELWSAGTKRPMRDEELPLTTGGDWPGHSTVLAADGKLLLMNDLGELLLLRESRERCEILSRASILGGELCWTQPAISGCRLLVRNRTRAACVYLGLPEKLQDVRVGSLLTAAEIPRGKSEDWLAVRLGIGVREELAPPRWRQLRGWYVDGLAVLVCAAVVVFVGAWLVLRRFGLAAESAVRVLPLAVLFGACATPVVVGALGRPEAFTWPLAVCVGFRLCLGESPFFGGVRDARRGRWEKWLRRLRLVALLVLSLGWRFFCQRFGLVFELAFLAGFVGCLPGLWLPPLCGRSGWMWLPVAVIRLGVEFSLFFWLGAGLMVWRAG